ncbi:hypothetical protein BLNAU_6874 [Blattamonas nauphoetae]|uniref:Uncharacterized protein n=1 Tax=Blattamonas nauphoetae TaxID=2049346 RepID=A0ABQ9Y355_9EUKA|nr:hypothetical protein BLNAU_6874 [Blattamonas nauphoetae]
MGKVRSLWPFNRDTHRAISRAPPPLFVTTEPDTINTIEQATPPFLSLVAFAKEGNHFDDKTAQKACALLRRLKPFKSSSAEIDAESTCMDSLTFIENRSDMHFLVEDVQTGIGAWQNKRPTFQKRGKQILAKLREEGLMDDMEIHFRCRRCEFTSYQDDFMGALVMSLLFVSLHNDPFGLCCT